MKWKIEKTIEDIKSLVKEKIGEEGKIEVRLNSIILAQIMNPEFSFNYLGAGFASLIREDKRIEYIIFISRLMISKTKAHYSVTVQEIDEVDG